VRNAEFVESRFAALQGEKIAAHFDEIAHEKAVRQNEDGLNAVI